jgi:hypothetical protein
MKDKILIEVSLKESRGDGDKIVVAVASHDSVVIKDSHVKITGLNGEVFLFMLHNVLYLKTVKEELIEEFLRTPPKKMPAIAEDIASVSKTMLL